jgi:peptide deformylase
MNIVKYPSKWLTKVCDPFDFDKDPDPKPLVKEMIETMLANNGIGLAAPQVEYDKAVFVFLPQNIEDHKEPIAVFNPTIINVGTYLNTANEGCLSHPGLVLEIKRPENITTEYLDIHGQRRVMFLQGIDARCFLHEFDHLCGTDFTHRVSKTKRDMALKKLKKRNKVNG